MLELREFGFGFLSGLAVPFVGFGTMCLAVLVFSLIFRGGVLFFFRIGPVRIGMFGAYTNTAITLVTPAAVSLAASLGAIVGAVLCMSVLFVIRRRWKRGDPLFRFGRQPAVAGAPAPVPVGQPLYHPAYDGIWAWRDRRPGEFEYAFALRGGQGICTVTNAPLRFRPGDLILVVDGLQGYGLAMRQMFTDGRWYQVFGQLTGPTTLDMNASGMRWRMTRVG